MSQPTPTETLREASARLKQQYLAYHATFGTCDTGDVLAIATERLAKKYRACYAAFVSRHLRAMEVTLLTQATPFFDMPLEQQRLMPAYVVPICGLMQDPLAKELSKMCLQAFRDVLLSKRFLNGRDFDDSPYRRHVEYVCGFENLAEVVHEIPEKDRALRVVNLDTLADGLKDLLECLEPRRLHRKNACKRKVATVMCKHLLRRVERFIAKLEDLPKRTMLEDFPMTEAELRAF
jgi:hypothetical protein